MADDVTLTIGAKIDQATAAISQVGAQVSGLANPLNNISKSLTNFKSTMLQAFGVGALLEWTDKVTQVGKEVYKLSQESGIAVETLTSWKFPTNIVGDFSQSLMRLARSMDEAKLSGSQQQLAFQRLGISLTDARGKAVEADEVMLRIADRFSTLKDGAAKASLTFALMGRGAADMIPFLNKGRQGLEEFNKIAEQTGTKMSKEVAQGMFETQKQIGIMNASFLGVSISMFKQLKSSIDVTVETISTLTQRIKDSIEEGGAWETILVALGYALKGVATAVVGISGGIEFLTNRARYVKAAFAEGFDSVSVKILENEMDVARNKYKEMIAEIWGLAEKKPPRIDITREGEPPPQRDPRLIAAAMKAADERIKIMEHELDYAKTIYAASADWYMITEQRKIELTRGRTNATAAQEIAVLEQLKAKLNLMPEQRQEIENRISEIRQKNRQANVQLDIQAINDYRDKWSEVLGNITTAFNAQLRGLITGTVTWQQAFKNILLDLILAFVAAVEKMVVQWAAGKLAMLTVEQTTSASMVTTQAAAAAAGAAATLPIRLAKFTSDLTADAALAYAGVFANLAPLMGPAAAAPAGVASETILALLAAAPKFDVGAWKVPQTGVAMVHKDEFIAPAGAPSDAIRSMLGGAGGGGDTSIAFNVQAWDGASVHQWLKQGGAAMIAGATKSVYEKNRSKRPNV